MSRLPTNSNPVLILHGDALEQLKKLPPRSVQTIVTSPPYWGLRSYLEENDPLKKFEIGSEPTPQAYVKVMVKLFRQFRRVLRDDGTVWGNWGDTYNSEPYGDGHTFDPKYAGRNRRNGYPNRQFQKGLKHKDMVGIPWRVALALRDDGWYLRRDIIWAKPNPMPESVDDRPTTAHEYIFLLTKSKDYFYDAEAIKEQTTGTAHARRSQAANAFPKGAMRDGNRRRLPGVNLKAQGKEPGVKQNESFSAAVADLVTSRNKRSVWTITTKAYTGAHFATFPPEVAETPILAGTSAKGCCADCGAPWERVLYKEKIAPGSYDGKYAEQDNRATNMQKALRTARAAGADHDNWQAPTQKIGWQPTCTCHGTFEQEEVIIPARISKEDATLWGATDGEYKGQSVKNHPEGIQDSSDVKARIIRNATEDRKVTRWVYKSDLPLDKHPIRPCIVLDPFMGTGTVAEVAREHGRWCIGVELNKESLPLIDERLNKVTPGLGLA